MRSEQAEPRALASPARRRVLDALGRAGTPVDAAELAESIGVHVTTARFHLDRLVEAGVVAATAERRAHRGRPRLRYALVDDVAAHERDDRSRDRLIEVLAAAVDGQGSEVRAVLAREAGRSWAESLSTTDEPPSAPTARLIQVLDELGFAPQPVTEGISLHACPFRDAARRHREVVCGVHEGLIREVLAGEASGSAVEARLLPFVAPDRCLVAFGSAR
ncbi:helix-turn-helix transcriptional regulator [Agromyces sp. CCNWLW203]|uniref:helix-turn-helix transcriptional regulator n=1 Tax=Agromyces sp. CCNWLW203 TaxID=3112842 RepID=UPI002F9667E8